MGKSVAFLAVEAVNSGKDLQLFAIDSWGDHDAITSAEIFDGEETYRRFRENIAPVADRIETRRMPSLEAAGEFTEGSCDFVFIDASHEYRDVLDDLAAWYPKVRSGGVLAGHDYHWPGVARAVREFARANGLKRPRKTELCWVIEVGEESRNISQRLHDLLAAPKEHLLILVGRIRYEFKTRRARG
jgi:hypothetical protein